MKTHITDQRVEEAVEELKPLLSWSSNAEGNENVRKVYRTLTHLADTVREEERHRKEKIQEGARDFAERFEGVMKNLAEEETIEEAERRGEERMKRAQKETEEYYRLKREHAVEEVLDRVEQGVPEEDDLDVSQSPTLHNHERIWMEKVRQTHNTCRKGILSHLAKLREEFRSN